MITKLKPDDTRRLTLDPVAWKAQLNAEPPPVVLDIEE
jgi:hypothetical protein